MIKNIIEKYEKLNKKIKIVLWIICLVLFLFFIFRMEKYMLSTINYNKGNKAFKSQNYDTAESLYDTSIYYPITKRRECNARINYALSITTPITPESVTYENLEESIERLSLARDILTEKGCAHDYDTKGHNKKAQTLKNEIDEYIEWLKNNVEPPEPPKNDQKQEEKEDNNDQNDGNDEQKGQAGNEESNGNNNDENSLNSENQEGGEIEDTTEAKSKEEEAFDELKELIEQDEKQGQYERFRETEFYENWNSFEFNDGQNW